MCLATSRPRVEVTLCAFRLLSKGQEQCFTKADNYTKVIDFNF